MRGTSPQAGLPSGSAGMESGPMSPARPAWTPGPGSIVLALGALLFAIGLIALRAGLHARATSLIGTTLEDRPPAANFALLDQNGQRVQLADLRGKVVALTFLYTHCPDVCPLIATKLGQADQQLGADRARMVLLAVSVDPANDSPAAAQVFDAQHGLEVANWHYLLGNRADLSPVWAAYYVGADAAQVPGAPALQVSTPTPQLVTHSAVVYLIDPRGRLRVALDSDFAVADFLHDVHALAQG